MLAPHEVTASFPNQGKDPGNEVDEINVIVTKSKEPLGHVGVFTFYLVSLYIILHCWRLRLRYESTIPYHCRETRGFMIDSFNVGVCVTFVDCFL